MPDPGGGGFQLGSGPGRGRGWIHVTFRNLDGEIEQRFRLDKPYVITDGSGHNVGASQQQGMTEPAAATGTNGYQVGAQQRDFRFGSGHQAGMQHHLPLGPDGFDAAAFGQYIVRVNQAYSLMRQGMHLWLNDLHPPQTMTGQAQSEQGGGNQRQIQPDPPAPVNQGRSGALLQIPEVVHSDDPNQPPFSLLRSDGVQFPLQLAPGQTINHRYLALFNPFFNPEPPQSPPNGLNPINPPANNMHPRLPSISEIMSETPRPHVELSPVGSAPNLHITAPILDGPTPPRPAEAEHGQNVQVSQEASMAYLRSIGALNPSQNPAHETTRVRKQRKGKKVGSPLKNSTLVDGGQTQSFTTPQAPTRTTGQWPQGSGSAEPMQDGQTPSTSIAATLAPAHSYRRSPQSSVATGQVRHDVSQSHLGSASTSSHGPLAQPSTGTSRGQQGATPQRQGRGPILGSFTPPRPHISPYPPAGDAHEPTPDLPNVAQPSDLTITEFENITAHTAKCDVCNGRNSAGLTRCISCGWQSCHSCTLENGCFRRHLNHISPVTPDDLIPLPPAPKKSDKKRRAAESPDREHRNTGKRQENVSEGECVENGVGEGPAMNPVVGRGGGIVLRGVGVRGRGRGRGRRSTAPRQPSAKTAAPKPSGEKSTRASLTMQPPTKEARGKDGAEDEPPTPDENEPTPGSPGNDVSSDAESATSSVRDGARALCALSANAFAQDRALRNQEEVIRRAYYAARPRVGAFRGSSRGSPTRGRSSRGGRSRGGRSRGGSSQRATSSVQTSSQVRPPKRYIEEDEDYDPSGDNQSDKDYVEEELDNVNSESVDRGVSGET